MRVALVNYTSGGASGSGRHVSFLKKGLQRQGIDVVVLDSRNTWHLNFPMLRAATFTLGAITKNLDSDVIHLHNPKLAGVILRNPSKCMVTVHGGMVEFSMKYGALGKLSVKSMLMLMRMAGAVTSVMKSEAERNGWAWVPNMTDLDAIRRIEPVGESFILFVGRNDPVKNYPLFKSMVRRLGRKYKAFGVEEAASWETVISHMKSADCLAITSLWEGMPSVLLEAWASGCPVIAPRIAAFQPFRDAVVLADHTAESYVEAYQKLSEVREDLVKRGSELVERFDYKRVSDQYVKLYRMLITQS